MTRQFLFITLSFLEVTSSLFAQKANTSNFHIGLIYPISSNGLQAKEYTNKISVNAIAGVSGSETSFCVAGFASIIKKNTSGFVASGFANIIGNTASGAQFAGFMNYVKNDVIGLQAAGFVNVTGSLYGMQFAGFGNMVKKDALVQAAGFINKAGRVNTQVAGFINVAKDVDAIQIAGFINVAKNVKGVQIAGLINIADSSKYPVGIVNFIKNGEKAVGITEDETLTTILTFRSGGSVLYGIVGMGYNLKNSKDLYALQAGMGAHMLTSGHFRINVEAVSLALTDFNVGIYGKSSLRILAACKIGHVELFCGPTFNYTDLTHNVGKDLQTNYMWSETTDTHFRGMYLGIAGGIQYQL